MKSFLVTLMIFTSTIVQAVDFRSFEEYKNNNALLSSDIERIEILSLEKNNPQVQESLQLYKTLLKHYEIFNSRLSLEKFSRDALASGWRVTSAKTAELVGVCEGQFSVIEDCTEKINQLKVLINDSRLKAENKEIIISFLNQYIEETKELSIINNQFITSFNEHSAILNKLILAKVAVPMSVKITPIHQTSVVDQPAEHYSIPWKKSLYSIPVIFLVLLFSLYKRHKKETALKNFYTRLFLMARKNKTKLRLFGKVEHADFKLVSAIEKSLNECISNVHSVSSETHVKFKNKKNLIKVEVKFLTTHSLLELIGMEALEQSLDNLQRDINSLNGELVYAHNLNLNGEITDANLVMQIPTT